MRKNFRNKNKLVKEIENELEGDLQCFRESLKENIKEIKKKMHRCYKKDLEKKNKSERSRVNLKSIQFSEDESFESIGSCSSQ